LSDGNFHLSTPPVPPCRGRIVITLGWHFFAKVGKDDEPIFDSFILRGNVAASACQASAGPSVRSTIVKRFFTWRKSCEARFTADRSNSLQPEANDCFIFLRVLASRHLAR
jgi:hypothetical protein